MNFISDNMVSDEKLQEDFQMMKRKLDFMTYNETPDLLKSLDEFSQIGIEFWTIRGIVLRDVGGSF